MGKVEERDRLAQFGLYGEGVIEGLLLSVKSRWQQAIFIAKLLILYELLYKILNGFLHPKER